MARYEKLLTFFFKVNIKYEFRSIINIFECGRNSIEKSIEKVSFFLLVVKISVNDVVFIRCGSRPYHIKTWRSNFERKIPYHIVELD